MLRNKIKLRRYLMVAIALVICLTTMAAFIKVYEYRVYTAHYNRKIDSIIAKVKEKYPDVSDNEIMEILNNNENGSDIFEKYGIDIENDAILSENDTEFRKFTVITIAFTALSMILITMLFLFYNHGKDKEIGRITRYIEQLNKRNYALDIDSVSEDELSILKNEIYKTMVLLRESADNSLKDKKNLKKSLEDISHQLKTPLTSVLVILDNLIDEPDMEPDIREEFIRVIKREVVRANFHIQTILKLSKFDANTITYIREKRKLRDIIDESEKNVSALCDLKNIHIMIEGDEKEGILCDFRWQVEAVTNIIKNCIEYSEENGKIIIHYEQNGVYSQIMIKDFGKGITDEDIPHIFERFYKGKNSSSDSIGIGLALAKSIVEEDKGSISAESDSDGTRFEIRYYHI